MLKRVSVKIKNRPKQKKKQATQENDGESLLV